MIYSFEKYFSKYLHFLFMPLVLFFILFSFYGCNSTMDLNISGAISTPAPEELIDEEAEEETEPIPTPTPTPSPTPTPTPTPTPAITFSGIDSIDEITDTTLKVNWLHNPNAAIYTLYDTTSAPPTVVSVILPPNINYTVTGLNSNTIYKYRLKATTIDGIQDSNTIEETVNTLASPDAPSLLTLINPVVTTSSIGTPTIEVSGVKNGDTIKLFSDPACLPANEIGTAISTGATVQITTISLDTDTYTVYAQAINPHNDFSPCSTANITYTRACPDGYVLVPPNPTVGTTVDFCAMKFEAKALKNDTDTINVNGCLEVACTTANWATIYHPTTQTTGYRPVSVATGKPWQRISQTLAATACANIGAGYALITNEEWMTIARNIENEDSNWSNGTVGDGFLNRGHTDNSPAEPCDGNVSNVDGNCSTLGVSFTEKRTHNLSNGEEIWDISGNSRDWVNWTINPANKAYVLANGNPVASFREYTLLDTNIDNGDEMEPITWQASNPSFNSLQNIGQYYAGLNSSGGAALRGGFWNHNSIAGVYGMDISNPSSHTGAGYSFRCAYHP